MRLAEVYRAHADWTARHQGLLLWAYWVVMGVLIAADFVMVLALRVASISSRVWAADLAHPTVIAAGVLGTVYVSWLVRSSRGTIGFTCLMGGHLFVHW